ncbi:MAG: MFS transporter [Planctomycetota bacterium]
MSPAASKLPRDIYSRARFTNYISGTTGPVAFNLIGTPILTGFIMALGLKSASVGTVHTIASLAVLLQFLGAYIVQATGRKRDTFILFGLLRWVPVFFLFYLPQIPVEHANVRLAALAVLLLTRGILGQMCAPAWSDLMNDVVPDNFRGRFWATRNFMGQLASAAAIPFFGWVVDRYSATDSPLTGYYFAFGAAIVLGMADTLIHLVLPEVPVAAEERTTASFIGDIRETCRSVLGNGALRTFLLYSSLLTFQANLFMLAFNVHALEPAGLGMSMAKLNWYQSASSLLGLAGLAVWGRVGDAFGYKVPILFNLLMRFLLISP